MSIIQQTILDLMTAWENHDLSKTAGLLANNFELTGIGPEPLYKDTFIMFQRVHNEAFPDWKFNVSEIRLDGHRVYLTFRVKATHSGIYDVSRLGIALPPIQPTAKARSWPEEHMICMVKSGKIRYMHIDTGPGGGLIGTLEWLGVKLPAPA
jgi:hypothetical protein